MNRTKLDINSNIENNRIEFEENKFLLWVEKFWRFCLFYGDYLASLHAKKGKN